MTNWVYIRSEPGLFTVGFYDPSGKWHAHADRSKRDEAAAEVARLNGGGPKKVVGPDLLDKLLTTQDRGRWLESVVRAQNEKIRVITAEAEQLQRAVDSSVALKSKVEELDRMLVDWDTHDCFDQVFGHNPIDVCTSPDDARFGEAPPEVLFRIERYYDSGDSSVGIEPTDLVVLAEDQSGTWIERVLKDSAQAALDAMTEEFAKWKAYHGIDFRGDAKELLEELLSGKERGNLVAIGTCPVEEGIQWTQNFVRRWEEADRVARS